MLTYERKHLSPVIKFNKEIYFLQESKSTETFRNIFRQNLTKTQLIMICSKLSEITCTTGLCHVSLVFFYYNFWIESYLQNLYECIIVLESKVKIVGEGGKTVGCNSILTLYKAPRVISIKFLPFIPVYYNTGRGNFISK